MAQLLHARPAGRIGISLGPGRTSLPALIRSLVPSDVVMTSWLCCSLLDSEESSAGRRIGSACHVTIRVNQVARIAAPTPTSSVGSGALYPDSPANRRGTPATTAPRRPAARL